MKRFPQIDNKCNLAEAAPTHVGLCQAGGDERKLGHAEVFKLESRGPAQPTCIKVNSTGRFRDLSFLSFTEEHNSTG